MNRFECQKKYSGFCVENGYHKTEAKRAAMRLQLYSKWLRQ